MLIGVTGNIAAGKSRLSHLFKENGARVIDADIIGHQLLMDSSFLQKELTYSFGNSIVDERGNISRLRLGEIVFSDAENLALLNRIFRPFITAKIMEEIAVNRRFFSIIVFRFFYSRNFQWRKTS